MPRVRDISIKAKLTTVLAVSFLLVIATGTISLLQLRGIDSLASSITESWVPEIELVGQIKRAIEEQQLVALGRVHFAGANAAADYALLHDAKADVVNSVQRLTAVLDEPVEAALLADFEGQWKSYLASFDHVAKLLDAGDLESAQVEFEAITTANFLSAAGTINDLLEHSRREGFSSTEEVRSFYKLSLLLIIVVMSASALTLGWATRWISQEVSRPILQVSNSMRGLTAGDRSVVIPAAGDRKDEIGVLLQATSDYRDSLERVRVLAEETATERQRLDTALTHMSQGVCMFDADDRLTVFNSRFAEIYGLSSEQVKAGMPARQLLTLALSCSAPRGKAAAGHAADPKLARNGTTGNLVERLADGRQVLVSFTVTPDGGFVATFQDITEELRIARTVSLLADYLKNGHGTAAMSAAR